MSQPVTLDMRDVLTMIDDLRDQVIELDGTKVNIEVRSREVNSAKAEVNRKLLYLAHQADLIRADLMNHYHRFKGENPPWINAD